MEMFKTIDIRGLSFFSALQLASQEFNRIKKNGILELIVDKKKYYGCLSQMGQKPRIQNFGY